MKFDIRCKECGVKLTFGNIFTERDINGKTLRCCRECGELELAKLKAKRFVEVYRGETIYEFEGKYMPYWGCSYYFTNIEDCRARIDCSNLSIVPTQLLKAVMRGEI